MIRLEDCDTRFGSITIFRRRQTGALIYDQGGSCQSEADLNGVSLAPYIHAIYGMIRQSTARRILMIGCGGGTLGTMLVGAGYKVSIVDINPKAFELAQRYFGLPAEIDCHIADGRDHLIQNQQVYDAVIVDAFHGDRIPSHFQSRSFFEVVRLRLDRHGILLVNVHVSDDQDRTLDQMAGRVADVFANVRILDAPGWYNRNAVIAAGEVERLIPPEMQVEPVGHAGEITQELSTMQFRTWGSVR